MLIQKLRSYRIGQFAIFDFATAFAAAYWGHHYLRMSRERALWLTIPAGIIVHKLMKIDTPLNRMVDGPDANPCVQMIVLLMVIQGLVSW